MTSAVTPDRPKRRLLAIVLGGIAGAGLGVAGLAHLGAWLAPPPPPTIAELDLAYADDAGVGLDGAAEPGPSAGRPVTPRIPAHDPPLYPPLTNVYEWPREPAAPADVDDKRFAEAFVMLCGPHADRQVRTWYAPWLLRAARDFGADPFLLGALVYRHSRCVNKQREGGARVGLSGLDPSLYRGDVRDRAYYYRAFDGTWRERSLPLDRFPFEPKFLSSPESNLYFAAAFLRAWEEQARGVRAAFVHDSDYRHYVSHWFWGDRVRSHREEDAVLVERRRLLEYYGTLTPRPPVTWRGFTLGCPLDGCPRLVTSTLGDSREGGARAHRGNDFESSVGEPVRAVADGKVVFAGVDLPGKGAASRIPIWAQRNVDPNDMGAGGLYVCIDHGTSAEGEQLVSCYMHLEAATVAQDRVVKRGEQVGRVGASGIKQSRPHLHFELHARDGVHAALEVLRGLALGSPVVRPPESVGVAKGQPTP